MGQMKKLWELAELIDRRTCTYGELDQAADVMRKAHDAIKQALDKIRTAEFLLNDWLVDNTIDVFEEQPDIDSARSFLHEAIDLLEETNVCTSGNGQTAAHSG